MHGPDQVRGEFSGFHMNRRYFDADGGTKFQLVWIRVYERTYSE